MPVSLKATSRRATRVQNTLFCLESTLSDEAVLAALAETLGAPQRNRPRADDPAPGCVSFGNPFRPSWTLAYTVQESGQRGYLVADAEIRHGRIVDAHEITFLLNALEGVLRRSDATAGFSEQRAVAAARKRGPGARFHRLVA